MELFGIVFTIDLASGEDLEIDKVPRDEAIRVGEAIREQASPSRREST